MGEPLLDLEIGIAEAKATLTQVIQHALDGQNVFLTKRGKRLVQVVAVPSAKPEANPSLGYGMLQEKLKGLPEDYWLSPEYQKEIIDLFDSKDEF